MVEGRFGYMIPLMRVKSCKTNFTHCPPGSTCDGIRKGVLSNVLTVETMNSPINQKNFGILRCPA